MKQAFWQVHLSHPKCVERPYYEVMVPNEMHQFDLLYIPVIHYTGISTSTFSPKLMLLPDIKSRSKQVKAVAKMIADIYKVGTFTFLEIFQCDSGSEFKAEVTKMLEKHKVMIRSAMTITSTLTQHLSKL